MPDEPRIMDLAVLLGLLALGLLTLAMLAAAGLGGVVLLGWGSRLAFSRPESADADARARPIYSLSRIRQSIWPCAFFLAPGFAQIVFSYFRPAPRSFRLLSWAVATGLTASLLMAGVFLALARAAGIETAGAP